MSRPIDDLMSNALQNIKTMVKVDTVVGDPMKLDNDTIILPISNVSFGFGAGGSEFLSKNGKTDAPMFGGGCGGGATVKPAGFLIINSGNVRFLPLSESSGPVDKIVDLLPNMVDKVNGFISKRKDSKEKNTQDPEAID